MFNYLVAQDSELGEGVLTASLDEILALTHTPTVIIKMDIEGKPISDAFEPYVVTFFLF